ncbi:MAG: hypothetical protein QOF01_5156 [Thermomicrobiales bacterium]|jgi:hypothetical protein|nr:hypothetical protein [Thermomicrobiales bacterium]MEA2598687.1 hypothetical protein [Thermomicrobiales bacterium]
MTWVVEYTNEFGDWFAGLGDNDREDVIAAVDMLEAYGPSLGRPFLDALKGSRYANFKELRPQGSNPNGEEDDSTAQAPRPAAG